MRLGRSCDRIVTGKVVPGCGSGRSDILRYYLPLATLPIRVRKLENDALSFLATTTTHGLRIENVPFSSLRFSNEMSPMVMGSNFISY